MEGFNPEHFAQWIVESSEDAIIGATLEGVILFWNAAAESVYGHAATDVIGQPLSILYPEQNADAERALLERLQNGERIEQLETVRRRKGGALINVSLKIAPIRNSNGHIIGAFSITRDIAARWWLNEMPGRLAAIVESSDDAIISKALDGTVLTWNEAAERIYGYSAEEMVGKPTTLLLPEDRLDEENSILDRILRGEKVDHFETVRRRKNGEKIDVSLSISAILDGNRRVAGVSHIARNITDRKRIEEKGEWLAAMVESAEDAIISKTTDGIILTWNAGAERVYGYTAEEAIGLSMVLLLPDDRPNEENEILQRIRRGDRVEHFETVRKTKSADLIDVSLTISPIRDSSGRIIGASHVARDVTERKQLEEQLRHTQKLESLGVLAGGVAHDFNNLLTGILGNASLAMESLAAHHPVRGLLRDVLIASERASHLTRQLLAYAGKGRFVIEPVNVSALVQEISNLIQTSIPKNVQLRLELKPDLPLIEADASQIQQVVMNLVINGAEAVPLNENGTVLVTTGIQKVDEHYLLSTLGGTSELPVGTYVSVDVHDTGSGMDEQTLSRIFDPFFTTKFTGRGLGLAAVQGIIRGHKGTLKVYSAPGKGTTFKVLFPAAAPGLTAPQKAVLVEAPAKNELILVVDDEDIVRRTAKSMLERNGYTVVLAENGKEGVELFQVLSEKVSAVLLDMTMPVMNGEEAFSLMRGIDPDVRVILSSGFNEVEAVRRFAGKGLAGFIQKPYSSTALLEKIGAVLADTER